MTDETLISPPTTSEAISPVQRTSTFAHKTSTAASTRTPFIDTSTPAINSAPVELDGAPPSPDAAKQRTTDDSVAPGAAGGVASSNADGTHVAVSPGLDEEGEIEREFLGEGGMGEGDAVREKRAAILAHRSKDPSVIVDVPRDPTAEEVEAAKSAEGLATPVPRLEDDVR
ncbi:hypothetical protein P280DRAFT_196685 [Massarina eburnea CBS 473.64]|uniref:Uncharacterized protein n=1 Tax=Massarina eburnea CBS 473.64 TaxID=1395130 RepID=A0A6A6RMQ3_9PLEO|nr:hypothetical protein P280DRAFT_196685 [Massarina eburnea CBS 473.64]